ncbi:hypothetical protein TrST_g11295 [Triparma strigata]|uniref:Uncharacterized protein n=1 Tax=Triparma strigata TaxID=1606541 RepID=A0A9W7A258_9STRA|nr:hypothetical protein TrST_g11295 [Triparma strigata]
MSEFTAAAAERIRNEIRQEFEGLEQKLEDAKNENACLRKILDDLQQIDALNVQNQRDTKSVGSMDHYLDWLKNLLRGHGQEDDVCDLVNVFLHELDRDELAVANHRGKVEDYEAVRTLFEEHPEFEMSFQSFLEAKMEEEVQHEEQRAIKTHKVLARRMSVVTLTPKSIQMFSMVHELLECRERAGEIAIAEGFLKNRMFEQKSLESFGEPPRQDATDTLDKLIEDATRAKTKLGMVLSEWLRDKLIDPDQIIAEGSKVFTKYPLKSREKCEEKAKTEFSGDYKNILDIVRCSHLGW